MDVSARARNIKLLMLDVDGVLTNGQIIFGPDGDALKVFNAADGLGISVARRLGLPVAIITGRKSDMVRLRALELNISDLYQGSMNKLEAFSDLLNKYSLTKEETAYIGDDLNDLPILVQVGLACAPDNAAPEVKQHVHYVSFRQGGQGAVRDIIELILKAQGKWDNVVEDYIKQGLGDQQ